MVYTGSGNVPYVQFESVGDFIPELRCSQMEGRKMGGIRGPFGLWSKGPRVTGARAKCSNVYCSLGSLVVRIVCVVQVVVD